MKSFNMVSLIRKKRDHNRLTGDEIDYIIREYTRDRIPDYQMSAMLMALYLNGIDADESEALTGAMLHSGVILDLSEIPGKKVDKHSTGGVGDKISLVLAPVVAAAGVPVPMISGRGLGHTGGTLDKLESITGFRTDISLKRYREILKKTGMVMAGQTKDLAPADKRMYALRDVTATVESIPLIASSIMSKKLAEGIDALVLDIKCGDGAFMQTEEDAKKLGTVLVDIGEKFGKQTIAYVTGMDQPLGYKIGNWLEVEECIDCLKGSGPDDVMEVTFRLAATMIWLGGKARNYEEGLEKAMAAIRDGRAWECFRTSIQLQGGDVSLVDEPATYPDAQYIFTVTAPRDGYITRMGAYNIGMASVALGAGRQWLDQHIDPVAGIVLHKKVGNYVKKNETIVTMYTNNKASEGNAISLVYDVLDIGGTPPSRKPLIRYRISKEGVFGI